MNATSQGVGLLVGRSRLVALSKKQPPAAQQGGEALVHGGGQLGHLGQGGKRSRAPPAAIFRRVETQALYQALSQGATEMSWGTGIVRGSFNPKYEPTGPRSPITVYTDGTVNLNGFWLDYPYGERLEELAHQLRLVDLRRPAR